MKRTLGAVRRLGRARGAFLLGAAALAIAATLLRPLAASPAAQDAPPNPNPGAQPSPPAQDEPDGGNIVFQVVNNRMQKNSVLYRHETHLAAGLKCDDCHEKIFKKKINGNKFKMADVNKGQFCGVCHNESPAADVKHPAFAPKKNCAKCHDVRVREPDK